MPSFSAFAISASAALTSLHLIKKSFTSELFLPSSIAILCCGEIARKLAPNIVSGLVENIVRYSSEFSILNFICAPLDLPIQFLCIVFTFSGQSSPSKESNNSSA